MTNIDPHKTYEFIYPKLSRKTTRTFHTSMLSEKIRDFVLEHKSKSYLELGSGFGGIMLVVSDALKDVNGDDYKMTGVDTKLHRNNYARQLLKNYNVNAEILDQDSFTFMPKENVDILFIDCGYQVNQKMIDRFGGKVNQAIFLHDVQLGDVFTLPEGFKIQEFNPKDNIAIIIKN